MAFSKEQIEKMRQAMLEHKQRLETDPEYRKENEEFHERMVKAGMLMGKDTDD